MEPELQREFTPQHCGAKSNITCGRKWHIKGYHSSFFSLAKAQGSKACPRASQKGAFPSHLCLFAACPAELREDFHFFLADINRKKLR